MYYYFSVYCNLFKELFLQSLLSNRNRFATAFVLKSGCKGMSFFGTLQMFSKKNALKHKEFRLFDKIWRNGGEITFYNICAREGRILRRSKNDGAQGKEENNKTTTKKERKMNAISRRHGNGGAQGGRKTMKKAGEKGTKAKKKTEEHEKKEKKEAEEQRRTRMEKRNNMELLYIGGEETPPHKEGNMEQDGTRNGKEWKETIWE